MRIAATNRNKSYSPKTSRQEREILAILRQQGPMTSWGLQMQSGFLITSIRRALSDMHRKGLVRETARAFVPHTKCTSTVYEACEALPLKWDERGQSSFA